MTAVQKHVFEKLTEWAGSQEPGVNRVVSMKPEPADTTTAEKAPAPRWVEFCSGCWMYMQGDVELGGVMQKHGTDLWNAYIAPANPVGCSLSFEKACRCVDQARPSDTKPAAAWPSRWQCLIFNIVESWLERNGFLTGYEKGHRFLVQSAGQPKDR